MSRLVAPLLMLVGVLVGVVLCFAVETVQRPSCPTEDSCTVDYRDGQWHIIEIEP